VQDRGSIKNQKSKTLSPTSPKSFRGRQGRIAGQSKIKKSKIKNLKSSRFPPSAGSGVNQKSKIKNPVAHIPQIISRIRIGRQSKIKNQKSKIL
jgi:hypothetical protein